jgi:hypothetical protein
MADIGTNPNRAHFASADMIRRRLSPTDEITFGLPRAHALFWPLGLRRGKRAGSSLLPPCYGQRGRSPARNMVTA